MWVSARAHGFSLTELMVALFVVAVVVTVGAPSLMKMVSDRQIESRVTKLAADLRFARSEAIKRNTDVTVRAVADDGGWERGWVVSTPTEGEPLSATVLTEDAGLDVTGDAAVVFSGDGIVMPRRITFASTRADARMAYTVNVSATGLVHVEKARQVEK